MSTALTKKQHEAGRGGGEGDSTALGLDPELVLSRHNSHLLHTCRT